MFEPSTKDWTQGPQGDNAHALRILLAEDTPISADAMKAMAHHFEVEMDTVNNGLEAIEMVRAAQAAGKPYSLLLVDVMMPILDGVETTRRLREEGIGPDDLPIIAVTAATSFDEIRSYRAAGMQAFLAKPVGMKDFKATLEAWGHRTRPSASLRKLAVLKELSEQFHARNLETLQIIESALAADDLSNDKISEIRHLLHQIAGTAATFGEPELSILAKRHENSLIHPPEDDDELRSLLEDAGNSLRERIK